jgi:D-serine deaminase-like pyridoxal phosphate-dependent protein
MAPPTHHRTRITTVRKIGRNDHTFTVSHHEGVFRYVKVGSGPAVIQAGSALSTDPDNVLVCGYGEASLIHELVEGLDAGMITGTPDDVLQLREARRQVAAYDQALASLVETGIGQTRNGTATRERFTRERAEIIAKHPEAATPE